MKPQVFIIMISDFSFVSWETSKSLPINWVIKFSESTLFFEQPKVITLTLSALSDFVFIFKGNIQIREQI